ncbi:1-deoxy-D-xylulose 5-phosphate reductoisomerase [compost metagenome]
MALAYDSLRKGGNSACVLNAANEVVVDAFLKDKISFLGMSDVIETVLEKVNYLARPSLDDYIECDYAARRIAEEIIN